MKGLLLTNDFPPMTGGEARLYATLCASVPAADVTVLAPAHPGDHLFDRAQLYRIERRRLPIGTHPVARVLQIILIFLYGVVLVRRYRPDKLHVGHLYLGPAAAAIRALYGIPYVLYLHGGEMAPYLRFAPVRTLVRRIVAGSDLIIVNSSFTREHFAGMGMGHPRTMLLPMTVNPEGFSHADRDHARLRYGLNGRKVLLTVGRLVDRKGHDTVIRALPAAMAQVGPLVYLIAGEGPQEARLRELAAALGVADHVRFLGRVPDGDLAPLYAACDLFVMPSRELSVRDGVEGFGIAFLEAAAAGRPSVGGRSGGIPDAIEHGVTGLLVTPDDSGELVGAICRLLTDGALSAAMGDRARDRVRSLQASWQMSLDIIWHSR